MINLFSIKEKKNVYQIEYILCVIKINTMPYS